VATRPVRRKIGVPSAAWLALVGASAVAGPLSAAATFIGVTDGRQLQAQCLGSPPEQTLPPCPSFSTVTIAPSPPFSLFDSGVGELGGRLARQTSSFSSTRLDGVGYARAGDGWGMGWASSTYSITFDVDTETPYTLSGQLFGGDHIRTFGSLSLSRGSTSLFEMDLPFGYHDFEQSGVLVPGRYDLVAQARNSVGNNGSLASFSFQLVTIPEPATALLLGLGLVALALRKRRPPRGVQGDLP